MNRRTWQQRGRLETAGERRTRKGLDLTRAPFDVRPEEIASPVNYAASQALGSDMREAGVEAFRFPSARDSARGTNVGIFTPAAFGAARPRSFETWHCTASQERVEVVRRDFFEDRAFTFPRDEFLVDGQLPAPAP